MSILRDWVWENYLMINHERKTPEYQNKDKELKNVLDQNYFEDKQILLVEKSKQIVCLQS